MSGDSLPVVWSAEAHTLAKHKILREYLQAWIPILSNQMKGARPVLFVDGFAGPGIYSKGEEGSPIIALRTALDLGEQCQSPVHLLFIEKDPERFAVLERQLALFSSELQVIPKVTLLDPHQDDCESVLAKRLDLFETQDRPFGPALVFLDQFGYAAVSMNLLARILKHEMCEVLSYLLWRDINRFITDPEKASTFTRTFGSEEWKSAIPLTGPKRMAFLLDLYRRQLRERAGAQFIWHFAMCGDHDEVIYWLFFATNNVEGLRQMKRAMLKVDDSGQFRFSDGAANQLAMFSIATDEWLAKRLSSVFDGKTVTVKAIEVHVLLETPQYKFAEVLADLERKSLLKVIDPPEGRKRGSFLKYADMLVRFGAPPPDPQTSLFGS
jgi:three-Cys-motif partner protein